MKGDVIKEQTKKIKINHQLVLLTKFEFGGCEIIFL